jgi:hypothetical protein
LGATGCSEAQIVAQSPAQCGPSVFRHVVGDVTVTAANTVIDHQWISGCVAIGSNASNVTIKDTLIASQDQCHGGNHGTLGGQINTGSGDTATGLLIEDTTVDALNIGVDNSAVGSDYFTCLRCDVTGSTHDVTASNHATIQDSYIHGLTTSASGAHEETVYADSSNHVTVEHSYLLATGGNGYVTGAFMNGGTWSGPTYTTLDNSYLEGGHGADADFACAANNLTITNNAFSTNSSNAPNYNYGWPKGAPGLTWTGNHTADTSTSINPGSC